MYIYFQIDSLLQVSIWGAVSVVPGVGWVIWGGYGNYNPVSQVLPCISGQWEWGPALYNPDSYNIDMLQCAVQVRQVRQIRQIIQLRQLRQNDKKDK